MPKSERSEQMLREQQNEACFDFDANEAFEIAQQFAFGHEKNGNSHFCSFSPPKMITDRREVIILVENKIFSKG
jgi:hypothetical protein